MDENDRDFPLKGQIPRKEGIHTASDVDPLPGPGRHARLASAGTLQELSREWRLFSLAPLFSAGRLTADPVQDWARESGHENEVGVLFLTSMVLNMQGPGLPACDPRAPFCLRAAPVELWPELFQFLGRLSGYNHQDRVFWRVVAQMMEVPDTRLAATSRGLALPHMPTVKAVLFGLDSTEGLYVWEPVPHHGPATGPPKLVRHPPDEETLQLGRAVLQGESRPLDVTDPLRKGTT